MQIAFVGFGPIQTSEHMAALGVFGWLLIRIIFTLMFAGLVQLVAFFQWIDKRLTKEDFSVLVQAIALAVVSIAGSAFLILTVTGKIAPWTGRSAARCHSVV